MEKPTPTIPAHDDQALLDRCEAGDEEAWRTLVARYERLVYAIPHRYGLGEEAAKDIFQEVFTVLVRQLPTLRRRTGLPKWLISTTRNTCRKWLRQRDRAVSGVADGEEPADPPPQAILRLESQHLVREALQRLGGRCEELIGILYSPHGPVGYGEAARRLGVPVGSIGPTRARCLQKLLEQLEALEQET